MKEAAYKSMVGPILEYGSTVWDPHYNGLNDELENVQKRAARFVTRNYSYETGSMTGILEELKWENLQKRREDNRLTLLYKGLKGKADDLIPKNRRCRNQHSLVFQMEAGQLGLVPTRPLSQLGLGSTRPGQLGLFIFLMVNRDITYVPNKKFGRYDLEYAR